MDTVLIWRFMDLPYWLLVRNEAMKAHIVWCWGKVWDFYELSGPRMPLCRRARFRSKQSGSVPRVEADIRGSPLYGYYQILPPQSEYWTPCIRTGYTAGHI